TVMVPRRVAKAAATTVMAVPRAAKAVGTTVMAALRAAKAGTTVTVLPRAVRAVAITVTVVTASAATGLTRNVGEWVASDPLPLTSIARGTTTRSFPTRSRHVTCIRPLAMS
ncbi:MAG TPA: hypothetical protein VFF85_06035, partial [Microbacterium sp.]|nr:hypothetical protein [Microbacterium sp.]